MSRHEFQAFPHQRMQESSVAITVSMAYSWGEEIANSKSGFAEYQQRHSGQKGEVNRIAR